MAQFIELGFRRCLILARAVVEELRIHQWVKNLLVFGSPLAARTLFDDDVFPLAVLLFFSFCFTASGIYVVNDLFDLKSDRSHPRKAARPFASGRLPLAFGVMAPALIIAGLLLAYSVSWSAAAIVACYAGLSLAYSIWLKTQPLVDVFTLSALYTLRLHAGETAFDIESSVWLLSFSAFLFLSLAFLKRVSEYLAMQRLGTNYHSRRGYTPTDVEILKMLGVSSSYVATMVLALYLNTAAAAEMYSSPVALWAVVPVFLFWQSRMWLAASRGRVSDDPIVYAARDWVSQLCFVLLVLVYGLASFA